MKVTCKRDSNVLTSVKYVGCLRNSGQCSIGYRSCRSTSQFYGYFVMHILHDP
jgi:hypothetical protein